MSSDFRDDMDVFLHELIGHGMFGLCHLSGGYLDGTGATMSTGIGATDDPVLTPLDRLAIKLVGEADLPLGAGRSTFTARGLIAPLD